LLAAHSLLSLREANSTDRCKILAASFSQGGKQYFDSGDYNMQESRKDRQEIASYPHAVNPHLSQLRGKSSGGRPHPVSHPSKLAAGIPPGRLGGSMQPSRLAGSTQPSRLAGSTQPSRLASSKQSPLAQ